MTNINWGRWLAGGLIASVIAFATDGFLHQRVIRGEWDALAAGLQIVMQEHSPLAFVYFAIYELGRGFLALFAYLMMRERLGAGPKTAVWAGIVSWLAFSVAGPAQFIPLGLFNETLWIMAGGYQLVASILAAVAGAAVYREPRSRG
ncbi:MAG: hypothetical protein WAW79_07155 [Steroidobacteraceae bacterium]